ncbi:MAG TPA: ATP-dependent Clp protease proteolytic subunit [Ktedonosporobacter sp.]|nr:ATP-dependent Clp protease proteolytic subunit [Ktedonosporobacter sp.]
MDAILKPGMGPVANSYRRRDDPVHVEEVPSILLKERIIFVAGIIGSIPRSDISLVTPKHLVSFLLYLEGEDKDRDIHMYINCYGSLEDNLYDALGIYDTMQSIKPEIATYGVGMVQGTAAALLAGGTPGKRYCLPHSQVVLHQPGGRFSGQASDIDIRAREIIRQRHLFYEILAKHTGQTIDQIKIDSDRRNYMTAQQALEYGLVDEIISPSKLQG